MKKTTVALCLAMLLASPAIAQKRTKMKAPKGKTIYIPSEFKEKGENFATEGEQYNYRRMATTPDIALFWEDGFGSKPDDAPSLNGKNMKVNTKLLMERLQYFYDFYKDTLAFVLPGSKTEKYRILAMLRYSDEGTVYGGDYDGTIGALWLQPGRLQDKKMNAVAHEIGHSFQSQVFCDGYGQHWGHGGGFFEMTSQWMLWQVNPEWTTDENFHWKGFVEHSNLRFLAGENIYHSPYVLEYWAMKRGRQVIADIYRGSKGEEDPAMTYMRLHNLSLDEMSDELADCYSRLITFDFPRVKASHRKFVGEIATKITKQESEGSMFIQPADNKWPELWGFNVVNLSQLGIKDGQTLTFKSLVEDGNATFRLRLVEVKDGEPIYGGILPANEVELKPRMSEQSQTYLMIMGCPSKSYSPISWSGEETPYRYELKVSK